MSLEQSAAPGEKPDTAIRHMGTLKQYIADKGFGFIARNGESDLFFHITTFDTPETPPAIGETLSFEVVPSQKKPGTLAAANVRRETTRSGRDIP